MVMPNFTDHVNKVNKKPIKLFNKYIIHTGQTVYLLMSIFYLLLLTTAFIMMLYGEKKCL